MILSWRNQAFTLKTPLDGGNAILRQLPRPGVGEAWWIGRCLFRSYAERFRFSSLAWVWGDFFPDRAGFSSAGKKSGR